MARIRSLKPEFWLDRKLARKLSRDERMLYMGLWNQADEHGRALGDPNVIKGSVFPYEDDLTVPVIAVMLKRLAAAGVVQPYEDDGDPYLFLPNLGEHQRLEPGKTKSKYPPPPPFNPADLPEMQNPDSAQIFSDESARGAEKSSLLYGTGSMEHGACSPQPPPENLPAVRADSPARRPRGGREVAERLNATAHSVEAHTIALAYADSTGIPVAGEVLSKIAVAVDGCLKSGVDPHQIAQGLRDWTDSTITAPSQISAFVHKAGTRARGSPNGKPTRKALGYQQAAEELLAEVRTTE
jgi:hypothetical protein